jgi:thiol-disulfide isomerase/thioredoxin
MRLASFLLVSTLAIAQKAPPVVAALSGQTGGAGALWAELKVKREGLPGLHQEFEISRTVKLARGNQATKRSLILDMSHSQWREHSISGSGRKTRIFDGSNLFLMEDGGDEFVRTAQRASAEAPAPSPYAATDADWAKGREVSRRPCGLSGTDHACVILDVPLKPSAPNASAAKPNLRSQGAERVSVDLDTGVIVSVHSVQLVANHSSSYEVDILYTLKTVSYTAIADANAFTWPSSTMREVKELSRWDAARIKKQLAGKPAPELVLRDILGNPITLADYRGKTVLLDFWTTWCPPCRADAPALDKLYNKYGDRDLMIVGISVSEDRAVVEKYLVSHPHNFPIVLTTENDMPAAYQLDALPTYIVIGRDGLVTSAAEGDQGFSDLRKLLKRAGLEID